jgi:hypothetical protein
MVFSGARSESATVACDMGIPGALRQGDITPLPPEREIPMRFVLCSALLAMTACAGAPAEQPAPHVPTVSALVEAPKPEPAPAAPAPPPPETLPTECASTDDPVCVPPADFVDRLCTRRHQDVALALFSSKTPFTRMYVRGRFDELTLDEEVIALRHHTDGMIVTRSGTYDVLRWDGTCSKAVDGDMLTKAPPPKAGAARVHWSSLDEPTQLALIVGDGAVKRAHTKWGHECMGAAFSSASPACTKADASLTASIVHFVRAGGTLPAPKDAL